MRITTILVTHDQTEANALADRIAVMEDGELQQYATPAELKERPANLFVGAFIGEPPMNCLAARVDGDGEIAFASRSSEGARRARLSAERDCARRFATGCAASARVTIGVRPHALRIGDGPIKARVSLLPMARRPDACRRRTRRPDRRLRLA